MRPDKRESKCHCKVGSISMIEFGNCQEDVIVIGEEKRNSEDNEEKSWLKWQRKATLEVSWDNLIMKESVIVAKKGTH